MTNKISIQKQPAIIAPCWREIEELHDIEWLTDCIARGFTIVDIARDAGCTRHQVMKAMKHYGIDRRKIQLAAKITAKKRTRQHPESAKDTMAQQTI